MADSAVIPVHRGTLVKLSGDGWQASNEDGIELNGAAGTNAISNVVSQRYGVKAEVVETAADTDIAVGMTLYDVRETDENGEKLIYNPRKAVEMECVLSGQAVPLVTKGIFLYSGAALAGETVNAGDLLYATSDGELTGAVTANHKGAVGRALGAKDSNGHVLLHLDISAGWEHATEVE
jgi:hypothetical protein